ncbi:alpha/beta hydrolase [Paucibacter sp. B2R-40]|uniref:alpha/beta hydrolase n=1 Tax=Paucibacter sp. B2R-40 TaxID=2893554 RepID=UPI0021E41F24|nr:lysophospholipase [Paucibacter sp. B2R-40]MCV2353765.1 alpha/beta hydrolase [Paucibacter sp. B2R-40]
MARILAETYFIWRFQQRSLGALLLVWVVASNLSGCAWWSVKERELALRPSPGRPVAYAKDGVGLRAGDQRFLQAVTAEDGSPQQLALWWLPHPDPSAPTLLYLHGTLRNLYGNLPKIEALRDAGFAIVAVDYRGWGDSTALIPSEASIDADVRTAWAELLKRQPDANKRVVFGHSMGGAVAVTLASSLQQGKDYGALVLESTFTRLPDVAAEAGMLGKIGAAITRLEFDSQSKIGRVDAPILMLHGSADQTVPVVLGRRLRDAAPKASTCWVEIEGGSHSRLHSEFPQAYRQALQALIASIQTGAPWPGECRTVLPHIPATLAE